MAADSEYARDHNRVENSENTNTIHRDVIVNHSHSQAQARIIGHPKSTHVQDINNALRHGTQVLTSIAKSTILPDMSQNISTGNAGGAGLSWNSYSPAKRRRIMSTGSSHSDKYAESDVDRFGDRESPGSISNRDCTVTRDSGRTTKSAFGFGGDGDCNFNVLQSETGIRDGWCHLYTEFWSGHNRLDPDYPGIFNILFSDTNEDSNDKNNNDDKIKSYFEVPYPNCQTKNKFDKDTLSMHINKLLSSLENELNDLIKRHIDERVLSLDICEHDYFDISQKYLGARLAHSSIIDRSFVMVPTGSSNTAGHDNMYDSTYSIQLQSHLPTFWTKIDNIGSSFNVRNVVIGGPVNTTAWKWLVSSVSSKTNNFYDYNSINSNKNDEFFKNNKTDMLFWESFMNDDGRPELKSLELHLNAVSVVL